MSLDPVSGGGTVERTLQLHKALLALGVKSHVLTINSPDKAHTAITASKDITALPCVNKRWFIPSPQISTVKNLIKEADVIHIMNHWTLINAWVYLVARKLGKPYVICPAGALTIFGRSTIKKHFYQWIVGKSILRNASAAIVVSPHETGLLKKSGVKTKQMSSPITLELGKIVCDTSYYGWLINFAQLSKIIAGREKVDYDEMWSFSNEIHKFLGNRPKMFPGFIGGHCVIPNLELLNDNSLNQIKQINNLFKKISTI